MFFNLDSNHGGKFNYFIGLILLLQVTDYCSIITIYLEVHHLKRIYLNIFMFIKMYLEDKTVSTFLEI